MRGTPGITIPQIAEKMGIEPNYLYRVMPRLATDGQVQARRSRLAPSLLTSR